MNCLLNPSLKDPLDSSEFYITERAPPNLILPSNIHCITYHPLHLDGQIGDTPNNTIKDKIIEFIRINDCTESGNVTELSNESLERLFSTPTVMAVLFQDTEVIGTMISPIFRVQYENFPFITSYTTFLCIDKKYRDQGLAMSLIRAVMKEGYNRYGINHGYYMTFEPHHSVHNEIKSWYRPLNIKRSLDAGFTLQTFPDRSKGGNSSTRQRLAYHIPKPSVLPIKAVPESYDIIIQILSSRKCNGLYLTPTKQELQWLCRCFDIYTVGTDSLFMLFPMTSLISSTGKRVRNAQVALMIGNVLPHALWIANENKYDLLYGWCVGDITEERVTNIRGLITISHSYLELYNSRHNIPINNMLVPIF